MQAGDCLSVHRQLLPPLPGCAGTGMRHIQFNVMEENSNLMQHPKAHTLTRCDDGHGVLPAGDHVGPAEAVVVRWREPCGKQTFHRQVCHNRAMP